MISRTPELRLLFDRVEGEWRCECKRSGSSIIALRHSVLNNPLWWGFLTVRPSPLNVCLFPNSV